MRWRPRGSSSRTAEVVIAHAKQVRAISHARVKSDRLNAGVLADLLAAELIPKVWVGDERVTALRRLVSNRRGLVKRRVLISHAGHGQADLPQPRGRRQTARRATRRRLAVTMRSIDVGMSTRLVLMTRS
jgi:hypothetical protein